VKLILSDHLIKRSCIELREAFVLSFLFFYQSFFAQTLIDSVIKFYQKPSLSYSLTEIYFSSGKPLPPSKCTIYSIKEGFNTYYLNRYETNCKRLAVIKNHKFYGSNDYVNGYYDDFKKYPSLEKANTALGHRILLQDSALIKQFADKKYDIKISGRKDTSVIELKCLVEYTMKSNIGDATHLQDIVRYYVSNEDYRIFKCYSFMWFDFGGFDIKDSSITTYSYANIKYNKVRNKILNFKPLKKLRSPEPIQNNAYADSIKEFPRFILSDTSNAKIHSGSVKSKYVLIDLWYKSCGPCMINMRNVEGIRKKYKEEDLEIIAINTVDKLDDNMKETIRKLNFSFKFLFSGDSIAKALKIISYPTTIIYDNSSRKIILWHVGTGQEYVDQINIFLKDYIKPMEN
jgi:thiol-disulfide isomerase/thioredoxin